MIDEILNSLEDILGEGSLSDLQKAIFRESCHQKTYPEIARSLGYDEDYIKYVGFQLWKLFSAVVGERVSKKDIYNTLARWHSKKTQVVLHQLQEIPARQITLPAPPSSKINDINRSHSENNLLDRQNLEKTMNMSVFCGRSKELAKLEAWITNENSRLISLLGTRGIGKTSLSVKLAKRLQGQFDYVICQSLNNITSLKSLLNILIQYLSQEKHTKTPIHINDCISQLFIYLQKYRCLIILDNAETILGSTPWLEKFQNDDIDAWKQRKKWYVEFLKRISDTSHQSCLFLISRERLKDLAVIEEYNSTVRSLTLSGLTVKDGQKIFESKGEFVCSVSEWQDLIHYCNGNPLALRLYATIIEDLFDSNISDFLIQETLVFGNIQAWLDQQFLNLSIFEREIMYFLAINRKPNTIQTLLADLCYPSLSSNLLEALDSLTRRFLIEKNSINFTLQPIMRDYIIKKFIKKIYQEIEMEAGSTFNIYSTIKSEAKNFARCSGLEKLEPWLTKTLVFSSD